MRGGVFKVQLLDLNVSLIPTYHPAASLYYPKLKEVLEEDFKKLRKELEALERSL